MTIAPFGSWKSPITSDLIVAQSIGLSEIRLDREHIYWLESRPQEAGRCVVVSHSAARDVTPAPFNVRTRVHEYGGGAWTVSGGTLFFSNFTDQRLYRWDEGAPEPKALTPEGPFRYADGVVDRQRSAWIGVREDHTAAGHEPINTIMRIDDSGSRILASGHDFYSSPRMSPDGQSLAWLAWDHPRMPWDGTTLYLGREDGRPAAVAGGERESIFQPEWSPDGSAMFFISDRSGWWNLYRYTPATLQVEALQPMEAEFGQPQWVFGMSTYAIVDGRRILCSYVSRGLGQLAILDLDTRQLTPIDLPYTEFSSVRARGNLAVFRAGSPTTPAAFFALDLATGRLEKLKQSTEVADDPAIARYFTTAQPIEFPTAGGRTAFALHYPAYHPNCEAPAGEQPPLVVKCHGGPTGAAFSTLDLRIQYWTSRGISVLDVNYGGSTGFGREYRQRLNGNWGIVDVEDSIHAARYLAGQGLADAARSVITGGSAGGYTTLAALVLHDYFRGGASHYGVSDLAALASDTHKFESRYLDSLVGPYPEREDLYQARSPLTHVARLRVPMIFFQGDEDRVVPPSQTELMVDALKANGVPVAYFLFSGEQHGFRKAENIKRALDAELYFFAANIFRCRLAF